MTEKKLLFVVCTTFSENDFKVKSEIYRFLSDNSLTPDVDYFVFYQNRQGLSKVYNNFFTEKYKDNIIVFVHDDVILGYSIKTLQTELNKGHNTFDIIGLAGAIKLKLTTPVLWHLMANGMSGSVGHQVNNLSQMSVYGVSPQQCTVVDGLFISVNIEKCISQNIKFDEQFTFHCYDLDFCIQAITAGLTVGTWPIWVTHKSCGLKRLDDAVFQSNQQKFIKKWMID